MEYLNLDLLIVIAFLFISLGIGLHAGRGITDIRDYALANKSYGTIALVLTYLATEIGGGTMLGDTREVFTNGIIMVVALLGWSFSFFLRAAFIAPHMHHFKGCLTLGDVMGKLYGPVNKSITGVLGLLSSTIIVSIQLGALDLLAVNFLGIQAGWGIIVGGLVLAIYSAVGGIKAVTATDVFQFLVLFAVVPLITAIALNQAGGLQAVVKTVPADRFVIWERENFSLYFAYFITSLFSMEMARPASMQRMLMASDGQQLKNMFLNVGIFDFAFRGVILLLGLTGLALYPHIAPSDFIPHLIQELLPTGIKGLTIAGVLAMIMSTADSHLHAAGLTFAHDVAQPLAQRYKLIIDELRWARYSTILLGCISVAMGLMNSNILGLSIQIIMNIVGSILTVPLIAGIIGLKPSKRAFYAAMVTTIVIFLSAKLSLPKSQQHLAILMSLSMNTFVFFGIHWLQYQGFAWANRPAAAHLQAKRPARLPRNLWEYSQQKVAQYGAPHMLFGLFCCFNFTLPYFMWPTQTLGQYNVMPYLRLLGAMLGGLLVVKEKWPRAWLPYFPAFWHLTLLYCIPFTSTLMLLLTQGNVEWLVNLTVTIFFLIVLVDWVTFFMLTGVGVTAGLLFYRLAIGPIALHLDFSSGYLLVYQGIFATVIGLLFARRKEQRMERAQNLLKSQNEAHETSLLQVAADKQATLQALKNTGVSELLTIAKDLRNLAVKKSDLGKLEALESKLIPMAFQLQGIDDRARDYLRLKIADMSLRELMDTAQTKFQANGIYTPITIRQTTEQDHLKGDLEQLATLFASSMLSLYEVSMQSEEEPQPIQVHIDDTQLSYPLDDVRKDYIKYVPAVRLVFTTQADQIPWVTPSYAAHLHRVIHNDAGALETMQQLASGLIIKSHYGYAEVSAGLMIYVIPLDLEEVRPKDMDKSYMALDYAPERANDQFKTEKVDAQAQEQTFLAAVEERSSADLGLVKNALELIKWYHGPSKRHSGEPFYLHPLAVAQIVLDYNQEESTIIGALLHDTIEDTQMLLQDVEQVFGKETAAVVDVVTHLQSVEGSIYKVKLSAAENLQMLERTGNQRGLYVKLADRMHNVRTIQGHKKLSKQQLIASETMQFFVPLAEKLGLHEAAKEFRKRCEDVLSATE